MVCRHIVYRLIIKAIILVGVSGLTAMPTPALSINQQSDTPHLMVLQYQNLRARSSTETLIPDTTGVYLSPYRGISSDRIAIRPGTVFSKKERPEHKLVTLYRGAGNQKIKICSIKVRYYQNDKKNWTPEYQLQQEPVLVKNGKGGWKPLGTAAGDAGGVVLTGNRLPSAEGYYRALEFTIGIGRTFVDSWEIQ